jgi:penicillin amidase
MLCSALRKTIPSLLTVAALVLPACGGDDVAAPTGDGGTPSDTQQPEATGAADAGDGTGAVVPGPFGNDVPVSGTQTVTGLLGPVDVVRDKNGMVHIYGTHTVDVMRVEGYQVARDRTAQVELLRRVAEGSIAEIAGASALAQDIAARALGIKRVGQAMYDAIPMTSPTRAWLDAYADGITQFNARVIAGTEKLPGAMIGIPDTALGAWTGADVLAVARYQAYALSYFGDDELAATSFAEASRAKFNSQATDPALKARAGFLVDAVRFDTIGTPTVLSQFPDDPMLNQYKAQDTVRSPAPARALRPAQSPRIDSGALGALTPLRNALRDLRSVLGAQGFVGSNDWIVGPARTTTGHTMVASDPHLSLTAPAVFWLVHLDVVSSDPSEQLDAAGIAFPGIAGIILGFNQHVAWGATDAYFDVSDVYQEQVTADGSGVVFNGQPVAFQTAKEIIPLGGGKTYEYDVQIVPQHGPILPTIDPTTQHVVPAPAGGTAMSERWTGNDVTHDIDFIFGILRATTVEDARTALRSFATGAENWVVGDDQGNVFYSAQANVPMRDKRAFTWDPATFSGTLPYFVLPGDGSAEWQGYLAERYVPHQKNPTTNFIATANNQQVPQPVANDPSSLVLPNQVPIFLGAEYDKGYRAGRVSELITTAGAQKISLDGMALIQADTRSPYGAALTPSLLVSLQHAAAEKATPGTHPDLTAIVADPRYAALPPDVLQALSGWQQAGYDAASGVDPDTNKPIADPTGVAEAAAVFNVWFTRMHSAIFADELGAIGQQALPLDGEFSVTYLLTAPDPTKFATYDPATGDSILFDDLTTTAVLESRDQRAILSLLDGVDFLKQTLGADSTQWRWGSVHTLRFDSLVSLWASLSIPPGGDPTFPNGFPRHGDLSTVDVGGFPIAYTAGPLPAATSFQYFHGPTQRFVVDLDPAGPVAKNVIPGGEIWDDASPHFRDEAELWRKNENHPIPFAKPDVVSAAESHVVFSTP